MTQYKTIVSDFDGTLVDNNHQVSESAKKAIHEYVARGGIFSIATGRMYQGSVQRICEELGITNPVIVRGGSEIVSVKDNAVMWGCYMKSQTVTDVITFLNEHAVPFAAERGEYVYTVEGKVTYEFGLPSTFKDIAQMPHKLVPKIVVSPHSSMEFIDSLLSQLIDQFHDLHIIKTFGRRGYGIDINDGGAGKHVALLEFAKLMMLKPAEIIGVGDSYNDYPLLTACGLKVVMGNAPKELLEIADHVVGTQAEDGIVEVLKFTT